MSNRNGTTGEQPGHGPRLRGCWMPQPMLEDYQRLQEMEAAYESRELEHLHDLGRLAGRIARLEAVIVRQAETLHLPDGRRAACAACAARADARRHRDTFAPDAGA